MKWSHLSLVMNMVMLPALFLVYLYPTSSHVLTDVVPDKELVVAETL